MNSIRKSRKIVLSDEEDDGNDADRDELLETPSQNQLVNNLNSLYVSSNMKPSPKAKTTSSSKSKRVVQDSASDEDLDPITTRSLMSGEGKASAMNTRSSRRKASTSNNDSEENEEVEPTYASKKSRKSSTPQKIEQENRSSGRSKNLSSKKAQKRSQASAEFRRLKEKGLAGVKFDSDEEYNNEEAEFDEDDEDAQDSNGGEEALNYYNDFFSKRNRPKNTPAASSTRNKKFLRDMEYEKDDDGEYDDDDMNNFIVDDDEDEEVVEEEEDDDEDEEEYSDDKPTKKNSSHKSSKSSKLPTKIANKKKRKIYSSDDDNEENQPNLKGEEDDQINQSASQKRKKRRKKGLFPSDEEPEEEEEGEENKEEVEGEEEEQEEEEEEDDGQLLYWRLNAQREEDVLGDNDEEDIGILTSLRKSFPLNQAMALYIELLGRALIFKDFNTRHSSSSSKSLSYVPDLKLNQFQSAARQIENRICTHRESLLASSAWKADFLSELQSRPFYSALRHSGSLSDFDGVKCEACGRSAQCPDHCVYLFGPSYQANKFWSSDDWINYYPRGLLLYGGTSKTTPSKGKPNAPSSSSKYTPKPLISTASKPLGSTNKQYQAYLRNNKNKRQISPSIPQVVDEDSANIPILSNQKKKRQRMIQLSDSEEEDIQIIPLPKVERVVIDMTQSEEPVVGSILTSYKLENKREVISKKEKMEEVDHESHDDDNNDYDDENSNEDEEEDNNNENDEENDEEIESAPQSRIKIIQWWEKKLPRKLNREAESKWHLAVHCKNRTNLYHTLLHYKFRLILKIRETMDKYNETNYELDELSTTECWNLFNLSVLEDSSFVSQELSRLESLLNSAGSKYGGDKYEHKDIWGEAEDYAMDGISEHRGNNSQSNGKLTFERKSTSSSRKGPRMQTSLTGWLQSK